MKFNFSLLILLLTCNMIFAQSSNNTSSKSSKKSEQAVDATKGREAIRLLQDGTLIVRLAAYPDKIKHLTKAEGKKRADQEQQRIDQANKDLMNEFEQDYSFSDIVFSYGADLNAYLNNEKEDVFLDENLMIDQSIKIEKYPILILASNSSTDFRLCDIYLTPLAKPGLGYVNHHLDKDNNQGVDVAAQKLREYATQDRTAKGLNKRLKYFLKRRSFFTPY